MYDFDATLNGVNDVSLVPDLGEPLAVDSVTAMVHTFDPTTAVRVSSVPSDNGFSLNTAAYRVPCPADFAPPYMLLDLADATAFIGSFMEGCPKGP